MGIPAQIRKEEADKISVHEIARKTISCTDEGLERLLAPAILSPDAA
jgi:hypothetical protein